MIQLRELKDKAVDSSVQVSDLLRKALVVSKELNIGEFEEWIRTELEGYGMENIPEYRRVHGQMKGWNPYARLWIPAIPQNEQLAEIISKVPLKYSISELEDLVERAKGVGDMLCLPMPDFQLTLPEEIPIRGFTFDGLQGNLNDLGIQLQWGFHFSVGEMKNILERVRNIILDWSLKLLKQLEENGVIDPKEPFSVEKTNSQFGINVKDVSGSNIQIQSPNAEQTSSKESIEYVLGFIYSFFGLIIGLACMLGGVVLFINDVAGSSNWTAKILGFESNITDAAPGTILFIVGIFIVLLTRFGRKKK